MSCFDALSSKIPLIVDYCDVFIDDPLMEWVWVSRKQLGVQQNTSSNNPSFSITQ